MQAATISVNQAEASNIYITEVAPAVTQCFTHS